MYGERKLAWTEVVDLLKAISEEEERNCERAIADEGPEKIGQPYSSKPSVTFSPYVSKSHAQKEKINKRVHELTLEAALLQESVSVQQAKKNLTECAYKNVPKSVGGKLGEAERKRKSLPQTQCWTSEYRERSATPPKSTSTQPRLKSNGSRTQGSTDVTGVGKISILNPRKVKQK